MDRTTGPAEGRNPGRIGILAGGGPLPARLAATLQAAGREVFIIGFEGFAAPELLQPYPHALFRLGAAGSILEALRAHGCTELVLLGPVRRPAWRELRPDAMGARLLARLGKAMLGGDNKLLAAIVGLLEEEGFRVRGAHEFLGREVAPAGALGQHSPDAQAWQDIGRAVEVLEVTSRLDMGQACVVQGGQVVALEALEGTDAMLARAQGLLQPGPGGILLKLPKKGQELRADMPAIGPVTLQQAARAGLRGIAYAAGHTLIIDPPACRMIADQLGLFACGLESDGALAGFDFSP
ncbi:LpxI family protein [Oecophyllibacter saccharovorans]|uniref:LpxI family protein n=1 Tax=Oecophyllibacter saccharovorans TaxID=2558360 RepID=UPI0011429F03|nr:UDP-2,3-diacylglucosamine diphosphatase LpxI [Oecophyllibacter saccharovorans]QDH16099.1 LpxI family protein [Oecophyllibacter saccharovorans]